MVWHHVYGKIHDCELALETSKDKHKQLIFYWKQISVVNCTHDVSRTLTKLLKDVRLTLTWNLPNKSLKGNFYVIVILQKVHTITYLQLAWPDFTLQPTLGLVPSVNHSKTDDWTKPLVWWFHAQGRFSICTETKSSRWKREFNIMIGDCNRPGLEKMQIFSRFF